MRHLIYAILITIVLVGGALMIDRAFRQNKSADPTAIAAAKVLPAEMKLKNIATKESIELGKLKGKVLLINFWASWCQACMDEMPGMVKLYESLKSEGFELVSINVDDNPEQVVPGLVKKYKMEFPVYADVSGMLASRFNVVAIPYNIIADRKMNIEWAESGERDWASDAVIQEFKKLLNKKS